MSTDLISWLNTQFDEDEQKTRSLLDIAKRTYLQLQEPRLLGTVQPGWGAWPQVEAMCVMRLEDIAAKREMVDVELNYLAQTDSGEWGCGHDADDIRARKWRAQ